MLTWLRNLSQLAYIRHCCAAAGVWDITAGINDRSAGRDSKSAGHEEPSRPRVSRRLHLDPRAPYPRYKYDRLSVRRRPGGMPM